MIQKFQKAERMFIPTYEEKTSPLKLKKFITDNFQIPDNDLERICEFISSDRQLEKIIFELPTLIQSKIQYNGLQIKFYDEFQSDELVLEVTAFSSMEFNRSLEKEDEFIHILYDRYDERSADKLLIFIEG